MPDGKEKLKKLHSNLVKDGYSMPDYAVFERDMADTNKLNKLHDNLLKDGYDLPDNLTFRNDMGYGQPPLKKKDGATSTGLFGGLQKGLEATPSQSKAPLKSEKSSGKLS